MSLEFRIPISPTPGFFSQVRFFNFALRRLGGRYEDALLSVVVGDNCNIDSVRRDNSWSDRHNVDWHAVPAEIFDRHGIWGTADWRFLLPAAGSETIILVDADTVLVGAIDPVPSLVAGPAPAIAGHMAHFPPPVDPPAPSSGGPGFWPWFFDSLDMPTPPLQHRYSMDLERTLPPAPAYFNLGFLALNPGALEIFASVVMAEEERINSVTGSHMRCQLAVTSIAYRAAMRIHALPPEYNLANDERHTGQVADMSDVRLIHYLRTEEMDRSRDLMPENIDDFLARPLTNPASRMVQALARDYRKTLR